MTDVAQLRAMKEALEKQIGPIEKKEKKEPAAKKKTEAKEAKEKKEKKEPKPKKGISPRQMLAAINRRLDRIDPNPGEAKLVEKMSDLKGLKGPFKVTRVGSENLNFTDGSGQEYRLKDSMAGEGVLEAAGKLVGMEKVKGEWKKKDAPKAEKKETPEKSFDPKDESSFVETFDSLKTGQIIKVRFDAVMGGSSAGEFKVGRRTKSKKYSRPEAITLIPMKDGKPVKTSAISRFRITKERSFADGNIFVGGTIGDMAVEIKELGRPKDFVQAEPSKEAEGKMTAAERKRLDVLQAKEDKQELSGAEEKTYTALVEKYRETAEYKAAQKKDAPKADKKETPKADKNPDPFFKPDEKGPISMFDDSAVGKLKQKIEQAKKDQEQMKAANKVVRNKKLTDEEKVKALVKLGVKESSARALLEPDFAGRKGYPAYRLASVPK